MSSEKEVFVIVMAVSVYLVVSPLLHLPFISLLASIFSLYKLGSSEMYI